MADGYVGYYQNNEKQFMKLFEKYRKTMLSVLRRHFEQNDVEEIYLKSKAEYQRLLPEIPYIGGSKNSGTNNLVGSAILMAYIRVLEAHGLEEREIGKMIFESFEEMYKEKPLFVQRIVKFFLSKKLVKKILMRVYDNKRQYEKYDASWQSRMVDVEGEFDLGISIKKCGICKFYNEQHMARYIKYLCLGDYPLIQSYGIVLHREATIAGGAETCDYRIELDGERKKAWPPDDLDEWF